MHQILRLSLIILCFTSYQMAISQQIIVLDSESSEPISNVLLTQENSNKTVMSNAKGLLDIDEFTEEGGIIILSALGYKDSEVSLGELKSMRYVYLKSNFFDLNKIVISATKSDEDYTRVPSRITTITDDEIVFHNPQTAADMLEVGGDVYVQKSQLGGGSPMIRGFATNRLLYSVDGVRMNTAIFRGGNIQNVINLDPFLIEKTEILHGPGTVLYGSDAIGGVMSFSSKTPKFSTNEDINFGGNINLRGSSANSELTGHLDVNIGWKKIALLSSISLWDFSDLKQGKNGSDDYLKTIYVDRINGKDTILDNDDPLLQRPSGYNQLNFAQKVSFSPHQNWKTDLNFHYSETSSYGRYDRHLRTRNGLPRYAEWNYGPQSWMMIQSNTTHTTSTKIYDRISLNLAYQKFGESRISRNLGDDYREIQEERVDAYSMNLEAQKSFSNKSRVNYGLEYVLNDVTSTGTTENILSRESEESPSRYPNSTWQSISAFANYNMELHPDLYLNGGIRYNYVLLDASFDTPFYNFPFDDANVRNGALTGQLGFVYRPCESLILRANSSTAFRSPNVDDIGKVFDSEPGAVTVPNPDLGAEYAYNFDIGAAFIFNDYIKVDVTGYYTYLDDAIVRRNYQLNGQDSIVYDGVLSQVQALQNASYAKVLGFQLRLDVSPLDGLNIYQTLNYQKGTEILDDGVETPSRHAAPMFGKTAIAYAYSKFRVEAYLRFQSEVAYADLPVSEQGKPELYAADNNKNPYAPSWMTLNLNASYVFTENLSLQAGVENILDRRYRPYSSGISAPGRNFIISIQASF